MCRRLIELRVFFILVFFMCLNYSNAQKSVTHQSLIWYPYTLNLNFGEKWSWQTEFEERHFIQPATVQHQFLIRTHVHRKIGKSGWEASVGMCYFMQSPNDPKAAIKLIVPELRPHVEVAYLQKLKHLSLDHRYRIEARFFHQTNAAGNQLEDGFQYGNFRFRYRFQATVPLWKIDPQRALSLVVNDEIHLNAGNKIVTNLFDQNRFSAGLSIDPIPALKVSVSYINFFQQRPTGAFFNRNILRIGILHTVHLAKKKGENKNGCSLIIFNDVFLSIWTVFSFVISWILLILPSFQKRQAPCY